MPIPVSRPERLYLDDLPEKERDEVLEALQRCSQHKEKPLRLRVAGSDLPEGLKNSLCARLENDPNCGKLISYVEGVLKLPIVDKPINLSAQDHEKQLRDALDMMNREIHGHFQAKLKVMTHLHRTLINPTAPAVALGLCGPAGCGKSSMLNVLSRVLQRPCKWVPCAGFSNAEVMTGHSYTYEGATPGKVFETLSEWGHCQGIMVFDEVDKLVDSPTGKAVNNLLLHITDSTQNQKCGIDKYYREIEVDLSKMLCAFSFNDAAKVDALLLDRIEVVHFDMPSEDDKVAIVLNHLLPAIQERSKDAWSFSGQAVKAICRHGGGKASAASQTSSGVRAIKKNLQHIVDVLNLLTTVGPNDMRSIGVLDPSQVERLRETKRVDEAIALEILRNKSDDVNVAVSPSTMYL